MNDDINKEVYEINESIENIKNEFDKEKRGSGIFEWAEALVISVLTIVFVFTFIVRVVGVDGNSMVPTLAHSDKLIIREAFYEPENGDIVVLRKESFLSQPIVKRIIATEGQEVDINYQTGEVFVDGVELYEDYINEKTYLEGDMTFPQVVPEGHIFVLGDNRNHSSDSRVASLGMVDEKYILGQVVFRILPLNNIGTFK